MHAKRPFLLLLLCCFLFVLPATELTKEGLSYALSAVYHGVFASVASQVSASPVSLPGVAIEERSAEGNAYHVSFNRSDISSYIAFLKGHDDAWYQYILNGARSSFSPLNGTAIAMLQPYGTQDVLLDGVIDVQFPRRIGVKELLDMSIARNLDGLSFQIAISLLVSGKEIEPMVFEGVLQGKGSRAEQCIRLETEHMTCNGQSISIQPMMFRL